MACAAILSFEEFCDTQRCAEIRQRLHDRLDQGLNKLEARVQDPTPTLEPLTPAVFALRQELTQEVTEGLVEQAHRAVMEQRTATCPQCGQTLSARGPQHRTVETLVGAIRLRRPDFYCERCCRGTTPLDEARQVTERRKQPDVQKAAVQLTKELPYETAWALFEELPGRPLRAPTAHQVPQSVAPGLTVLDVAPSREEIVAKIAARAQERSGAAGPVDGGVAGSQRGPVLPARRRPDGPGAELASGPNGCGGGGRAPTGQGGRVASRAAGPPGCDCRWSPLDLEASAGLVPLGSGELGLLPW